MFSRVLQLRVVNVFVASTFDDLQAERTILRQQADELRKRASEYGIKFAQFVDLRWGISDEQVQSGKLLQLCLRAVDMCVPYFIGIIGGRNGNAVERSWLDRLKDLYPFWNNDAIATVKDFSVTEIEIWHALHNRQRASVVSAVFFALQSGGIARPIPYGPEVRRLLTDQHIVPFKDCAGLKRGVLEEMDKRLLADAGGAEKRLRRESAPFSTTWEHDLFAAARVESYKGDLKIRDMVTRIDRHLECYFEVLGSVGIGKSTYMALLARQLIQSAPKHPVFLHFCSLDDVASDLDNLLKRMIEEIALYVGVLDTDSILDTAEKISRLPIWLEQAGKKAKDEGTIAVFLIDGLDQLKRPPRGKNAESKKRETLDPYDWAAWLPPRPPEGTSIVLAYRSGEGRDLGFSDGRPCSRKTIEPLSDFQRIDILKQILSPRQLEPTYVDTIIRQGGLGSRVFTGSPLFLITVADELKATDNREQIPARVTRLAGATDFVSLFRQAIRRMETDFHESLPRAEKKLFVRLLGLIVSSRRGLSRDDLVALNRRGGVSLEEASTAWDLAAVLLQRYLIQRDDRYFFSHEEFRAAVEKRLAVGEKEIARQCRADLAKYFFVRWRQVQEEQERTGSEKPWTIDQELPEALLETMKDRHQPDQKSQAAKWLLTYLTDPRTRLRRCGISPSESCAIYGRIFGSEHKGENAAIWERFWRRLKRNLAKSELVAHEREKILLHLGKVLNIINENERALLVAKHAIRLYQGGPTLGLATLLAGDIAREQSSYNEALGFYQDAADSAVRRNQTRAVRSQAYFGIARIHRLHGRHSLSLENYQRALDTIKRLPESSTDRMFHLPWCYFGLGEIHRLLGKLKDSAIHYDDAKARFKEVNDPRGIAYAAWGQGELARLENKLGDAEELYQESEDLCKAIHDRRGIAWAKLGFAEIERAYFYQDHECSRCDHAIKHCQNLIDDVRLSPTERNHARLQLAECYRVYSVIDRSHVAAARDAYERSRDYYKTEKMSYCERLAQEGLAMLEQFCARSENVGEVIAPVEPHPITLP